MSLPSPVYSLPEHGIQLPLPNWVCSVAQYISVLGFFKIYFKSIAHIWGGGFLLMACQTGLL